MTPVDATVNSLRALRLLWIPSRKALQAGTVIPDWQRQKQADIAAARVALDLHWSVRFAWLVEVGIGVVGLLLGLAFALSGQPMKAEVSRAYDLGIFGTMGGCLGLLLAHVAVRPWLQALRPTLRHLLEPASREPFLCKSAADFADTVPAVRQYRDETVAHGRELTVADVYWMLELGYKDKVAKEAEAFRQNCLRLHGVGA